MVTPFLGTMPHGGTRQYGGQPTFGVWDKVTARFVWAYRGKNFKVARLVCEAFHGPAPEDAPVCIHIDENSANNRPGNLKWGTQKENLNGDAFIDYCHARIGQHSPTIKGLRKKLEQQAN